MISNIPVSCESRSESVRFVVPLICHVCGSVSVHTRNKQCRIGLAFLSTVQGFLMNGSRPHTTMSTLIASSFALRIGTLRSHRIMQARLLTSSIFPCPFWELCVCLVTFGVGPPSSHPVIIHPEIWAQIGRKDWAYPTSR